MSAVLSALRRAAALRGTSTTMSTGTEDISAARLLTRIETVATGLNAIGARVAGLAVPNGIDWAVADLAAAAAGVVCVPIPPFLSPEQRDHIVISAGIDTWIADVPPGPSQSCRVGDLAAWRLGSEPAGIPPGVGKITFTSGTTGRPKGVLLDLSALEEVARALAEIAVEQGIRRHLCCLPLAVLLENVAGLYGALLAGATVLTPPESALDVGMTRFDAATLARSIDTYEVQSAIMLPQMLIGLTEWAERHGWRPRAMRLMAVGGAPIATTWIERARALGLPVHQGYGMSEWGSVIALDYPATDPPDSCGIPLPGRTVRLTRSGEIEVTGGGFLGYLGGPYRSPEGWWKTGDLGRFDSAGRLHVLGRADNLIVTAMGRNVSPEWIESRLAAEQAELQAIVLGPDLRALVSAPSYIRDAEIRSSISRVNQGLPAYAAIRRWKRISEPGDHDPGSALTPSGRPRRDWLSANHPPRDFIAIEPLETETL